jgi:hypothetical protein
MPTTEENWDTREVWLWLSNEEGAYTAARRCRSADEMKRLFHHMPGPRVTWSKIDWDFIYDRFEEDREE